MSKWKFLTVTLLCISQGFAQEITNDSLPVSIIRGNVINAQTQVALESVHVINLNQVRGAITDKDGNYQIQARVNDTLYFTFLGFKPEKVRVSNDMLRFDGTQVSLNELAFALEEVVVRPYQLTGYLDIDVKYIPTNDAFQYSISGLNKSYESRKGPNSVTKILGAILNPADLLRNLFGKRPRQMKKLNEMKADQNIRDLLATKFDRVTLMELLQLEKMDIDDILNNCDFSNSFITTANDLQILEAISSCYEEYRILNR
jgi:hypothetical protein